MPAKTTATHMHIESHDMLIITAWIENALQMVFIKWCEYSQNKLERKNRITVRHILSKAFVMCDVSSDL